MYEEAIRKSRNSEIEIPPTTLAHGNGKMDLRNQVHVLSPYLKLGRPLFTSVPLLHEHTEAWHPFYRERV